MTKRGGAASKLSEKIFDDPIWNIIKDINKEFTGNNGWFCSDGLFYVCSQEGTKVYTKEEFEKIRHLFDEPGDNSSK